ncbi:MAG: tetratricopeptide repeat protein [Verrucomicrobia bacterium]|nr:tetratricopeptide repeat protein [Verrucomicrobiota bacterium]
MTATPPPAPEIRSRLRAVWDHLSRRRIFEAGELLQQLPRSEPAVRNALGAWHLARGENEKALELLRPLAMCPDEITLDDEADIAWRANCILALLKSGSAAGFRTHLGRLKESTHPGIAAMRKLADEAGKSRGMFSRLFGSAPVPEIPSNFPPGWPESWLAAEPSSTKQIPSPPSPVGTTHVPASPAKPVPPASRPAAMPAAPTVDLADPLTRREIRVFISSTFRDMQKERELLVKNVFPELRRICDERFVSFTEVDLRWGITEEQAAEGKVLPICLEEIHNCRPYFIGLLGERYGWIPNSVPPEALAAEPWIQEHVGNRTSVTELEILHGVLRNPAMAGHSFFYFRDPAFATSPTLSADEQVEMVESDIPDDISEFGPEEAALRTQYRRKKLAALKETIRQSKLPLVDPYENPEALAAAVRRQFLELIDQLYPKEEVPEPLDQEAIGHRTYARRKLLGCIKRPTHLAALNKFVESPSTGQGLVVTGDSGGGKTALLAAFVSLFSPHPSFLVFEHYFGATDESTSVPRFLHRLLGELKRRADIPDEIPSDPEKMAEVLPHWLAQTAGKIPQIVLVLDALNQIKGEASHRNLSWLCRFFPDHVRVIASSLSGPALDTLRTRDWATHPLPLTDADERGRMIDTFLDLYHKTLSPSLRDLIVNAPGAANPLFLRTVLEELRQFGDFDRLPDKVADLLKATTPVGLFRQVIRRWQTDYHGGRDVVDRSLRDLWAMRQGLGESEWLDLLADECGPMDRQTWRPLFLAVATHLVQRSGLWAFGHDYLRQAIERELLPAADAKKQAHLAVADYFERHEVQREMTPRKAAEWPFQLHAAEAWDRLEGCLTDIPLFLALYNDKTQWELTGFWHPLRAEGRDMGACYTAAYGRWTAVPTNASDHSVPAQLGRFLSINGLYPPAELLLRRALEVRERVYGAEHPYTLASVNNLALLLSRKGDYTGAQPLCERALEASERVLGAEHPDTLANVKSKGDYAGAQPLYQRTLEASERVLGAEHPDTLASVNNLASLLESKGDYAGAQPLYQRALEARERVLGAEHPETLASVNNLALLLSRKGDYAGAQPLYERALEASERVLGAEHPKTLVSVNNLAYLLEQKGDYAGAQPLHERALTGCERVLGPEHPLTLTSVNNLARLLFGKGDYAGAMALFRRALQAGKRVLGPEHPETLKYLKGLAVTLEFKGNYSGAEPLMREELQTSERILGLEHPETLGSLNNLGRLLMRAGKHDEAEPLYRRALEARERVLGAENPDTLGSVNSLAVLLYNKGDYAGAQRLYERALEGLLKVSQTIHRPHPDLNTFAGNYAGCLEKLGRSPEQIRNKLAELGGCYGQDLSGAGGRLGNQPSSGFRVEIQGL